MSINILRKISYWRKIEQLIYSGCAFPQTKLLDVSNAFILIFVFGSSYIIAGNIVSASSSSDEDETYERPTIIKDLNLSVQLVYEGLESPTSMAFLGPNDILVTEKDEGTVQRIVNGDKMEEPILDTGVANEYERGMLGIAISNQAKQADHRNDSYPDGSDATAVDTNVFLFFTESSDGKDGSDSCDRPNYCESGYAEGNRLYKYKFEGGKLVDPELLLDVPAGPGADHNGGAMVIGPDNHIYLVAGDGDSCKRSCEDMAEIEESVIYSRTSNFVKGDSAKGRGGIIRISQDGEIVGDGILGSSHPLDMYYAYGIRNSFGLDFDPVTGNLWDTENGPGFGDEINLVRPGFNSGWAKAQGMWEITDFGLLNPTPKDRGYFGDRVLGPDGPDDLVEFSGNGRYSNPELAWNLTRGITALKFYDSDKLGIEYQNDMFVGDVRSGNLYHFDLNGERTDLVLDGSLSDKIVNSLDELEETIFAKGFPTIVDIEVSPDGYLYILGYDGSIYKIVKN